METYRVAQLNAVEAKRCVCGWTRRAFTHKGSVASLHVVDIQEDAKAHYHRVMTEIYLVLEGEGHLELDGKLVPVRPMTSVYIPPGVRHRAIGKLRIVNIPIPAFDENDEYFD